jgi:drug/metabolite transporter (DMT)-like permease
VRSNGTLLCLAAAAAFGAMAIFGKLAYDEGATVGTLLSARFVLAAALFWAALLATRRVGTVRALGRRDLGAALALGAIGYALQAGCFFVALGRMDASLLSLLLYTYPAIVATAAVVLGRERLVRRRVVALAMAFAGLVLVLAGAGAGAVDPLGAALALAAAVVYSAFILTSERVGGRVSALPLTALVCTGAAVTLTLGSAALGQLRPAEVTVAGWAWLASLSVVSTVGAIGLFFAGLRRAGPTTASILSTVEPVITVVLAYLVFGEVLTAVQLAGGALVLAAVVLVQLKGTRSPLRWSKPPARRPATQTTA